MNIFFPTGPTKMLQEDTLLHSYQLRTAIWDQNKPFFCLPVVSDVYPNRIVREYAMGFAINNTKVINIIGHM